MNPLIIISLSLIGLALIIIIFVIVRKFPALAILDAANIPGEKEEKFKQQIMRQRVDRDLARWSGLFGRVWLFLKKRAGSLLWSWHGRLKKAKAEFQPAVAWSWPKKHERIKELFLMIEDLFKKEDLNAAEEKLVEIISLDQKNLTAFFELGNLYEQQKKWPEARQTYEYALKLIRQKQKAGEELESLTPQEIYFCLANVEKEAGDADAALENIREALEFEPNSPRYLDLILDLSIIRKDRTLAEQSWEKLVAANPENQKLTEWKEKIEEL